MNAAIYCRISKKDSAQDTENQAAQIREWAARNGHAITEEYADRVSGSGLKKRPAFERMLTDAASQCPCVESDGSLALPSCPLCHGTGRRFSMLLFWSLDRLSREGVYETLQHLRRLNEAGVCWRSHTEAYLDSCGAFKDAVLAILAAIAKQERIRISERVTAGLERARGEGRVGGRRPAVRNPEMVARIVEMTGTHSVSQIADAVGMSRSVVHRIMKGGL